MSNELVLEHKEMTLLMVEAITETRRPPGIGMDEAYGRLFQHDVDQSTIEKIEIGVNRIERYIRDQALKANIGVS